MANTDNFHVDVLAIGAHPDDVELSAGGTVAKLVKEGRTVAMIDMTQGELGTRGTGEIRLKESEIAANILGAKFRENLNLPDGGLHTSDAAILKTIYIIRKYRPKAILMPPPFERHPDHEAVNRIVRSAMFKSGLRKIRTEHEGERLEHHRIRKMFCYLQSYEFHGPASFFVDITDTFEQKMEAIQAYASQVNVPGVSDPGGPETRLSRPEFIEELKARAIYFGTHIGVRYAEPFYSVEPVAISRMSDLL